MLPNPAGFMALPATLRPEEAELVTPQLLLRPMNVPAPHFRYLVFDLGVAFDHFVLATTMLSDNLLLVSPPELSSLQLTRHLRVLVTRHTLTPT